MADICVNIRENEVINFGLNKTIDPQRVISFKELWAPPFVYKDPNVVCGPLIKILQELSKCYGYSLSRISEKSYIEVTEKFLETNNSIILTPATQSTIELWESHLGKVPHKLSRSIGIIEEGYIASGINRMNREESLYLHGFEAQIWIAIFLILLVITLFSALINKSFSKFLIFWEFFHSFISRTIPNLSPSTLNRLIISLWLLFGTVLIAGYSGAFHASFILTTPDDMIDTWEQLYEKKGLTITTSIYTSYITTFSKNYKNENEMARQFSYRINEVDLTNSEEIRKALKLTLERKTVISGAKHDLDAIPEWINHIGENLNVLNNVHISKCGGGVVPYFMFLSKSFNETLERGLNKMIIRTVETGLYDKWTKETQRFRRKYLLSTYKKTENSEYETKSFSFYCMRTAFYVWSIGITIAILVFIIELHSVIKKSIMNCYMIVGSRIRRSRNLIQLHRDNFY